MKTKQVINLWESLGKTLKRIEKHNAHQIDVDTALQQVRDLYAELLNTENVTEEKITKEENTVKESQEPVIEKQEAVEIVQEEVSPIEVPEASKIEKDYEEEEIIADDLMNDPIPEKEETQTEKEEIIEPVATNTPEPIKESPKQEVPKQVQQPQGSLFQNETKKPTESLGESLGKDVRSMNDTMSKKESDLASKFQSKPIADIRAAINLGDRFLFIKELFNGNADEFNQTIDTLNSKQSMNDAKAVLSKYNWEDNNETVDYFMSIVQRKYIPVK